MTREIPPFTIIIASDSEGRVFSRHHELSQEDALKVLQEVIKDYKREVAAAKRREASK